jgi:hypothetical protein
MSMGTDELGQTPEQQELARKLAEVSNLETALAEKELTLATLHVDLHVFYARYVRIVGTRYARLDEIEAQIAEATARLNRSDTEAQTRAARARTEARKSAEAASATEAARPEGKFTPTDRLKKLYREAAKRVHPDLATDDQERSRRQKVMAEINQAYEAGDEERLQRILRDWQDSPESVTGDGPGVELVRAIRKIAQVERRLRDIEAEVAQLTTSDLYQLKARVEDAESKGQDLLAQMATDLDHRIESARERLAELTRAG